MDKHSDCYDHIEVVCTLHCQILYTALNHFFQFVEDRVTLLECSPASCLVRRNHCKEKSEKFITHRINNKLPSHFSFDKGTVPDLKSQREHIFFIWVNEN